MKKQSAADFYGGRIHLGGDRDTAMAHLPEFKSKVRDFATATRKAGLMQNRFSMTFEDGTKAFAQYVFGKLSIQVYAPPRPNPGAKEKKPEEPAPYLILVGGKEGEALNVAKIPLGDGGPMYPAGGYLSIKDVLVDFPACEQREHHVRRYAVKTDRNSISHDELLSENYTDSNGKIDFFSPLGPGPICSPVVPTFCGQTPGHPMFRCQSEDSDSIQLLDYIVTNDLVENIAHGFSVRAWCYSRQAGYISNWAHKREVTSYSSVSPCRLSFCTDIFIRNNDATIYGVETSEISTTYILFIDQRQCTSLWEDNSFIIANDAIAAGSLTIEVLGTPSGPAVLLSDVEIEERIDGFYNSDPDFLAYGYSEPFTHPLTDQNFLDFFIQYNEYKENKNLGAVPSFYAFSPIRVTFDISSTVFSKFISPLTDKTIAPYNLPSIMYQPDGDNEDGLGSYNNIEADSIVMHVEGRKGIYCLYFKIFLEATFTFNSGSGLYDQSDTRMISMGSCSFPESGNVVDLVFLKKVQEALEFFRFTDSSRISADGPYPIYGSLMAYLHNPADVTEYLQDEVDLLEYINTKRAQLGADLLTMNHCLCVAARIHANDMAANVFLGHIGTDSSNPAQRIDASGFGGGAEVNLLIGENCGYGYDTAFDQYEAWRLSTDGHYEAMVNTKFKEVGLALAVSVGGVKYRCAVFAGDADLP